MSKVKRWLLGISGTLILVIFIALAVFWKDIQEFRGVMKYAGLFKPDKIVENFRTMNKLYPTKIIHRTGPVYELPVQHRPLPETFIHNGETKKTEDWIKRMDTTGMIVLKDGVVVYENYFEGNNKSTPWIAMSVSKSFLSFLVGVALEEGKIDSIQDPVDKYDKSLKGGGYEGVSMKNVLQMSSGIRFTEHYGDLNSDIVRMVAAFTAGSIDEFILTLPNERTPGTYHRYVSADTQVLGMALAKATGKNLTDYMQEKLWSQLGAEYNAEWITDTEGTEIVFGGLIATLRDWARFGMLYLNKGRNFKGQQLVSENWVNASVTPDAPHLMPGRNNPNSASPEGYGYQWWIPETPDGDFVAQGVYGQFIYISPKYNVVIAKTSAYRDFNNSGMEMILETLDAFNSIAKEL